MLEPELAVEMVNLLSAVEWAAGWDSWSVAMLAWKTVFEENAKFTVIIRGGQILNDPLQ